MTDSRGLFPRRCGILAIISWFAGVLASAGGLWLSFKYDLPTGPLIVCAFGFLLLTTFVAQRLRGEAAKVVAAGSTERKPRASARPSAAWVSTEF